jgi:hypothetical protein
MENASKALIIVGAVLIAILLIGFGVMIMNNSTSQVNPDVLNSQAAQAHNSQFTNYTGDKIKASQVKALMNNVVTNNVTGKTADTPQQIYVKYGAVNGNTVNTAAFMDPSAVSSAVRNGYTYTVKIENQQAVDIETVDAALGAEPDSNHKTECYYSNGYIRIITITENLRTSTPSTPSN